MVDIGGIFGGKKQDAQPQQQDMMGQEMPPLPGVPMDAGVVPMDAGVGMQEPITPTSNVLNMQQQGISNNQIVQDMTQQGYTPDQINDAMNMASVKGAVDAGAGGSAQAWQPQQAAPQAEQQQMPPPPPPSFVSESTPEDRRIEELAEAIIEEKWRELSKNIDKIIEWKEKTETKVAELETGFNDLKKSFESLHDAILGKVSEYDQNIISLSSDIKAMEMVFQKLLPTFTENVNELSRITKGIKKK